MSSIAGATATLAEQRVKRGDNHIYVRHHPGSGPAFVLMHGFPDHLGIYDRLAPLLSAAGRQVVAFDFLGYGRSDKPVQFAYSFKQQQEDLTAVLDALEIGQAVPVAHDASGPAAINFALDHPERVAGLALLNTFYAAAPTLRFPELIALFAEPALNALAEAIITDPAQMTWLLDFQARQFQANATPNLRARNAEELVPLIREQLVKTPSAGPAFVQLTRQLHAIVASNTLRLPELHHLPKPVKIIWGAGDPYLNAGVAENLGASFPDASVELLPLGHWPQIDGPEQVARLLLGGL